MHGVAVAVADDLDLDVAWVAHIALEIDGRVAERRARGLRRALDRRDQLRLRFDDLHAYAATATGRLQHHRKTDLAGLLQSVGGVDGAASRRDRNAILGSELARSQLGSESPHRRTGRPDELDSGDVAGVGECRFLGEKTVSGVDRLGADVACELDDLLELQVRVFRRGAPDVVRLIRIADVDRGPVRVRVHGGSPDAELAAGTHDSDRDLAAVGDENLVEEFFFQPTASSGWVWVTH